MHSGFFVGSDNQEFEETFIKNSWWWISCCYFHHKTWQKAQISYWNIEKYFIWQFYTNLILFIFLITVLFLNQAS